MIKKIKCYLENLLNISMKIKILKKLNNFLFIFLILVYNMMQEQYIAFLMRLK